MEQQGLKILAADVMPCGEQDFVINQQNAQSNRQQVEEAVIPSEFNQNHQANKEQSSYGSKRLRRKDEERGHQFNAEHYRRRKLVKAHRQLVSLPGQRRGQRLRFIMER